MSTLQHAFLCDETTRSWTLAPAYDLNPDVANVLIGLSWFGGAAIPQTHADSDRMAELAGIRPAMGRTIIGEVEEAVIGGWRRITTECRAKTEGAAKHANDADVYLLEGSVALVGREPPGGWTGQRE